MAELMHVRVVSTGEERIIAEAEALESATQFKVVSDAMVRQSSVRLYGSDTRIESVLPTLAARNRLNETFAEIDDLLVISGVGKAVRLASNSLLQPVELSAALLATPGEAYVGTVNWDARQSTRQTTIDGKSVAVEFTDDHTDYHRELYAGLGYNDAEGNSVQVTYTLDRDQSRQAEPAELTLGVWHSSFADIGYDHHTLHQLPLTVPEELAVIRAIQVIGGVSLETI